MTETARGPLTRRSTTLLLGLILLAGLTLRTWNLNFDRGIGSHPDERSTACFYAPSLAWPQSWEEFKDPHRSPLNPLWDLQRQERRGFTYGHFPLYLGVLTGELLHKLAPLADKLPLPERLVHQMEVANQPCGGVAVAGRLLIALLDTWTILLLFFLARRLYGTGAGLLASAFYAFTAQAIQLSHFFAMDPASTTFTVLAVLGGVRMVQERRWQATLLTGLAMGLAISSKFSALPILALPVVAGAVVLWRERQRPFPDARVQLWALASIPLALLLAFAAFFLTSPYAVLDWKNFVQATLVEQGQMVRGVADFPFTRQYRNTLPYVYFIEQQVRWGLGWPLGVAALLGTGWALVRLLAGRAKGEELLVWSWLVPYFGLTGAFLAKFNRYMSPVLPFALLFAAGFVVWLWRSGRRTEGEGGRTEEALAPHLPPAQPPNLQSLDRQTPNRPFLPRFLSGGLAAIALSGAIFWSLAYVHGVYGQEHTWIQASRWVYQNAPPGSVILWELWDDPLPKAIPGEPGMDMGSAGLRHIDWSPYEEDTPEKYRILKEKLREADYVIYSSKRIYDSVDELPERYPMTIRYYDLMFQGKLGFELVADITAEPRLLGFRFPDQQADESWSLYDHPRVTIFRKVRDLSDAEFDALLGGSWEGAIPWYRGKDSPLSPLLNLLGLGSNPDQGGGLVNKLIALLSGEQGPGTPPPGERRSLMLDQPVDQLPLVDNYRWNQAASERPWLAVAWWWGTLTLLGLLVWPVSFALFPRLRDRGYFLSRTLGWLLSGWLLWILASLGWAQNTVVNAWLAAVLLGVLGLIALAWQGPALWTWLRTHWKLLLVGEGLFAGAYLLWVLVRMGNPDLWQPWFGGEKFMEFAFLNGILRSPTFPPVDPHFAGGFINYYYFGLYLVAYLVKLTGIYAEVAFNLAIPTIFALTVLNAFAVAYSALGQNRPARSWKALGTRLHPPPSAVDPNGAAHSPFQEPRLAPALDGPTEGSAEGSPGEIERQMAFAPPRVVEEDLLEIDLSGSASVQAMPGLDLGPQPGPQEAHPSPEAVVVEAARPGRKPGPPSEPAWTQGLAAALLAPFFVAILGNLDGMAQVVRRLAQNSDSQFRSAIPLLQPLVRAGDGLWLVLTTERRLPPYDFWEPSRVLPNTINEFPFWSFLFADLHPHLIGIPFAVLFLGLVLAVLRGHATDWRGEWRQALLLTGAFALLLGTLASINLWELPTYFGLGVLAVAVSQHRGQGRLDWPLLGGFTLLFLAGAYLLFLPFFRHYVNVGASGVGLVREPDPLGRWLLIWGFFLFVLASWLLVEARRRPRPGDARPNGLERWLSLALRCFDRLPRLLGLQRRLVTRPSLGFLLGITLLPLSLAAALVLALLDRWVLALCLPLLTLAGLLLWRRGRQADAGGLFTALLTAIGFAILAGTQVVFLKDFLQGGDWYRMNTLFKFFMQVWVLWGIAGAVALVRLFQAREGSRPGLGQRLWNGAFGLLLAASLAYPLLGTPARLDQRFPGWRPDFGTLNALDFMRQGIYRWPDESNPIELSYDWQAIQWLLENVRGNLVIAESSQLDYYRAGGTRVASLTGLSGISGMHESEQRYGDEVGARNALLNELWSTPDLARTRQILDELNVALIYVGQLERHQHPQAVDKFQRMAEQGQLVPIYRNPRVVIYAAPGKLIRTPEGWYAPASATAGQ